MVSEHGALTAILALARRRGEFAIVCDRSGQVYDIERLCVLVERAASRLRHAGVGPAERVLYCGDQGVAAFVAFWATIHLGAVFVPVSLDTPDFALRRIGSLVKPRLMLLEAATDAGNQTPTLEATPRLHIHADGRVGDATDEAFDIEFADSNQRITTPATFTLPDTAPAAYILTSGSTAEPKAVVLSHAALAASAGLVAEHFAWRAGERLLNLPDPHTMSGLRNAFIAAPAVGMRWIPSRRAQRGDVFALVGMLERVRPERIVAAPLFLRHLNLLGRRIERELFAATRAIYCTGTDLNTVEVSAFHAKFGTPVINYYGLTETVGLCLTQRVDGWQPGNDGIGFPVGCEIRRVDDAGFDSAPDAIGELWVRKAHPMSGYLDDPAGTAAAFAADGWLRTGDLAQAAPDGQIVLMGRRSSFIKTTLTERINPLEIEAVLDQHESIAEAAVCGIRSHGSGGERIATLLVRRAQTAFDAQQEQDVVRFVTERLGVSRAPALIRWVDALPRSANGKIQRARLPDWFRE